MLTRPDGTTVPRVLGRTPYLWSGGPAAQYVVPRTASSRLRVLDLSLFDVTDLARVSRHGRTPVLVRLRPGVHSRTVTGLRLAAGGTRTAGGATVLHGSFGPHFAGFTAGGLRGIASVRLDAPRPAAPTATVPAHTVRVHVARRHGAPADFAMVTLQNTLDGDSYLEQADVDATGVATFSDVPEGEYSVVVQTFEKVLVDPQFEVTADTTVELNLGDATVKAQVTLPGHRILWTSLNVERDPEKGFGIPFGLAGPRLSMRVQPTSGKVLHGALHTGVTATLVSGRQRDGYDNVALTADVSRGVPADLTFAHHRRDFSRLTDVLYANGPSARRPVMVIPGNSHMDLFAGMTAFETPIPGRLHVWMQAGPSAYLQQTIFPLADSLFEGDNTQVGDVRSYRKPGTHRPLTLLHGPVGPGLEAPPSSRSTSGAVRQGRHLLLFMPLFSAAGSQRAFTFADRRDATWSLHQGRQILAHGHQAIFGDLVVPRGPRTYQLDARTHPGRSWDLSTHVRDVWTFHSRAGQRAVPLLTPSYVPPTDLAGNLAPGHTGYRLSFHSTPHSARVATVSFELSTNGGRTWHRVPVRRTSALTFHVGYRNPGAHGMVRYVSVRVTASDVRGNSVQETAIRAYRLR